MLMMEHTRWCLLGQNGVRKKAGQNERNLMMEKCRLIVVECRTARQNVQGHEGKAKQRECTRLGALPHSVCRAQEPDKNKATTISAHESHGNRATTSQQWKREGKSSANISARMTEFSRHRAVPQSEGPRRDSQFRPSSRVAAPPNNKTPTAQGTQGNTTTKENGDASRVS